MTKEKQNIMSKKFSEKTLLDTVTRQISSANRAALKIHVIMVVAN